MTLKKIRVQNFRLLKDAELDLNKDISLLVGKNNTGKTSFIMLLDKFFNSKIFTFDDFSLELRNNILDINSDFIPENFSIKMLLEIEYTKDDNLKNISDFIVDLETNKVNLLFECIINKDKLMKSLELVAENRERFIKKNIKDFLSQKIYAFSDIDDLLLENRTRLVAKELPQVKKLVNLQIIHAKREVSSSENDNRILSKLTTDYFNKKNKMNGSFDDFTNLLLDFDNKLENEYSKFFTTFLENTKNFLGIDNLKVVSNLQSKEILEGSSQVIYGDNRTFLPENHNGLGYMNIIYLMLQIEIKKSLFVEENRDINILIIEEPEAHTHPQMQYVFSEKLDEVLKNIKNLQTLLTTHSSHIISQQKRFKDIRYFLLQEEIDNVKYNNVKIKNFYVELEKLYSTSSEEKAYFKFLNQYLSLNAAELFFANKIIFIEGISERILINYFIREIEKEDESLRLSSQHISILEVGANSKAFGHFLKFLDIKTLIITDIDTTKKVPSKRKNKEGDYIENYQKCEFKEGINTSNISLKYFFKSPDIKNEEEFAIWFDKLKKHKLTSDCLKINLCYQIEENGYHARSFEDAFINVNRSMLKKEFPKIDGLKNKTAIKREKNIFKLTDKIIDEKSSFASSILYNALSEGIKWEIPKYIKDGLIWLAK